MSKSSTPPRPDPIRDQLAGLAPLVQGKRFAEALPLARALLERAPADPRVLWMVGICNAELGRHGEAIGALTAAAGVDPENLGLGLTLVDSLRRGGEPERALDEIDRVLSHHPGHLSAMVQRASLLMDAGAWEEACEWVEKIRESDGYFGGSQGERAGLEILAAQLAPDHADAREAIVGLESIAASAGTPSRERRPAKRHLGRLYDSVGEYDKAFAAYSECQSIGKPSWDPEAHSERVERLIQCWEPGCGVPTVSEEVVRDGSRLVFILGMMRSGTSLAEQMIAQLDGVTPGGEMNAVSRQISPIEPAEAGTARPLPMTRERYTGETIDSMALEAWARYDRVASEGIVTDKQPYNFFYIPLIARLFPGCKIIHCVRDPIDTCLSNYFQSFTRPHPQTHDLEWLGRYYRDYEAVMEAWHRLPEISMIDLRYEGLVSDPQEHLGRVLEFIGLGWDERVLRFHESDRALRTASRDQVRSPLYGTSVKKHERYHAHLGPLRRGLGMEP